MSLGYVQQYLAKHLAGRAEKRASLPPEMHPYWNLNFASESNCPHLTNENNIIYFIIFPTGFSQKPIIACKVFLRFPAAKLLKQL